MTLLHDSTTPSPTNATHELFLKVVNFFCTYYSLLLILVGCVCNPLSILVLSRRSFRASTTAVYLRVLSLSDLGAILNGLLRYFVLRAYGIDLRQGDVSCYVSMFFVTLFLYTSSWTLVIVTGERVVSIMWPHRVHHMCSRQTAWRIMLAAVALICCWAAYFITGKGNKIIVNTELNTTTVERCVTVYHDKVFNLILMIADGTFLAFLPSFIIIVFNIIIVIGVVRSRKKLLKFGIKKRQTQISQDISVSNSKHESSHLDLNHQAPHRSRKEASLTRTLVAINSTFVICNFPAMAWGFGPHHQTKAGMGPLGEAINQLLIVLIYTNNVLNFVLYCVTGSKFRKELHAFLQEAVTCRVYAKPSTRRSV